MTRYLTLAESFWLAEQVTGMERIKRVLLRGELSYTGSRIDLPGRL